MRFGPEDGPPDASDGDASGPPANSCGAKPTNATEASETDADARFAHKSYNTVAVRAHRSWVPLDDEHGLVISGSVGAADGRAEVAQVLMRLTGPS